MDFLSSILFSEISKFFFVFARILGLVLAMPFLSQIEIPGRIKGTTAIGLSLIFFGIIDDKYFVLTNDIVRDFIAICFEFIIGYAIGMLSRFSLAAIDFAGQIISMISGFSMSSMFNPSQSGHTSAFSAFLSIAALSSFLVLDGHHIIFKSVFLSYKNTHNTFSLLNSMLIGDFLKIATNLSQMLVNLGVKIAIPFLVINTIMQLGLGIVSKLVPQIQVFFLSMSLQSLLSFTILAIVIGSCLLLFEKNTVSIYTSLDLFK